MDTKILDERYVLAIPTIVVPVVVAVATLVLVESTFTVPKSVLPTLKRLSSN